jgi:hypothetical protein
LEIVRDEFLHGRHSGGRTVRLGVLAFRLGLLVVLVAGLLAAELLLDQFLFGEDFA